MSGTERILECRRLIAASDSDPAKKLLASHMVASLEDFAGHEAPGPSEVFRVMEAQYPLILMMFLENRPTTREIAGWISTGIATAITEHERKEDDAADATPFGKSFHPWQRVALMALSHIGWPAAAVIIAMCVLFREPLQYWLMP